MENGNCLNVLGPIFQTKQNKETLRTQSLHSIQNVPVYFQGMTVADRSWIWMWWPQILARYDFLCATQLRFTSIK